MWELSLKILKRKKRNENKVIFVWGDWVADWTTGGPFAEQGWTKLSPKRAIHSNIVHSPFLHTPNPGRTQKSNLVNGPMWSYHQRHGNLCLSPGFLGSLKIPNPETLHTKYDELQTGSARTNWSWPFSRGWEMVAFHKSLLGLPSEHPDNHCCWCSKCQRVAGIWSRVLCSWYAQDGSWGKAFTGQPQHQSLPSPMPSPDSSAMALVTSPLH